MNALDLKNFGAGLDFNNLDLRIDDDTKDIAYNEQALLAAWLDQNRKKAAYEKLPFFQRTALISAWYGNYIASGGKRCKRGEYLLKATLKVAEHHMLKEFVEAAVKGADDEFFVDTRIETVLLQFPRDIPFEALELGHSMEKDEPGEKIINLQHREKPLMVIWERSGYPIERYRALGMEEKMLIALRWYDYHLQNGGAINETAEILAERYSDANKLEKNGGSLH